MYYVLSWAAKSIKLFLFQHIPELNLITKVEKRWLNVNNMLYIIPIKIYLKCGIGFIS